MQRGDCCATESPKKNLKNDLPGGFLKKELYERKILYLPHRKIAV
jgi:hypothetical protein